MVRKRSLDLKRKLQQIDGKGYRWYKEIFGEYEYPEFVLRVDHVQGDPFASPSKVTVWLPIERTGIPSWTWANESRRIALCDFLTRVLRRVIQDIARLHRGSGKSGLIEVLRPGQEILERDSVVLRDGRLEVRMHVGLPAHGRTISAHEAIEMFFKEIPKIVRAALFYDQLDHRAMREHIETAEDADWLRARLREEKLVAFVADEACLPRVSGVDPRPMTGPDVVRFVSPPSMRRTFSLPNRGPISGMAIPEGVTLIVGGGYHGKSTLLEALQLGIYNHIPGDGREFVVSVPGTVKIRAEDGRSIRSVNISPFIGALPRGGSTENFSTDDASGSTSQAANIIEALEMGAELLLLDEDTSATNFMIRDHRMQKLLPKQHEPITPFIDRVRELYEQFRVSTILVIGGSGEYFDVADRVICMIDYRAHDFTDKARAISEQFRSERAMETTTRFGSVTPRIPDRSSFDPSRGKREVKINPKGVGAILFGRYEIDLDAVEQIVETAQTRAIGEAIFYAMRYMDGRRTLREVIDQVMKDIREQGLDVLSVKCRGEMAAFRPFELAAAINRLRSLRMRQRR